MAKVTCIGLYQGAASGSLLAFAYKRMLSKIISKLKGIFIGIMSNTKATEYVETKICKKCGRILPIEKFRSVKGLFYNPYYLSQCKECEYKYQREY